MSDTKTELQVRIQRAVRDSTLYCLYVSKRQLGAPSPYCMYNVLRCNAAMHCTFSKCNRFAYIPSTHAQNVQDVWMRAVREGEFLSNGKQYARPCETHVTALRYQHDVGPGTLCIENKIEPQVTTSSSFQIRLVNKEFAVLLIRTLVGLLSLLSLCSTLNALPPSISLSTSSSLLLCFPTPPPASLAPKLVSSAPKQATLPASSGVANARVLTASTGKHLTGRHPHRKFPEFPEESPLPLLLPGKVSPTQFPGDPREA